MIQAKFSVEETQAEFLNSHMAYGFKDKSAMVRAAIENLKKEIGQKRLMESADLYSEVYSGDGDLKTLTEAATSGWPE